MPFPMTPTQFTVFTSASTSASRRLPVPVRIMWLLKVPFWYDTNRLSCFLGEVSLEDINPLLNCSIAHCDATHQGPR